jgi:hypothetical protein
MPSVVSVVGKKIKKVGGDRQERHAEREERRAEHREEREERRGGYARHGSAMGRNRGRYAEAFEGDSDSDWLWGTFFLVGLLFVLSPGVLITLPPGRGGLFMSGNTSLIAALVHAVLIVIVFNYM